MRIANGRLCGDTNGDFTYMRSSSSSVIDYLLLKDCIFPSLLNFCIESFNEWSDHAPLSITLKCKCNPLPNEDTFTYTRTRWKDDQRDDFRRKLIAQLPVLNALTLNTDMLNSSNVNQTLDKFIESFRCITDPLFSYTVNSSNTNQFRNTQSKLAVWFDDECREAKQLYKSALHSYNLCRTFENGNFLCEKRKLYKALVKKKKRVHYRKKFKSIENLRHKKPQDFWKLFCSKKNNYCKNINVNEFYEYFSNLSNEIQQVSNSEAEHFCNNYDFNEESCNFEELDKSISIHEVEYVIRNLNKNKATGIDCLINEFFIESCDIISSHLTDLFNGILNTGCYPDQWAKGIIIPLHKKNSPDDVNNYRGITLLSCLAKIFTGIINRRLSEFCENNDVISDAQFGFRPRRSTTDAIFVLHSIIQKFLQQKKRLYCAFIDMKKAFDSVYRNGLWYKLGRIGIKGKLLRILRDMYSKIKSCVKSNNNLSDFFESHVGLLQGEITSPILFSLFIDDLELFLQKDNTCGLNINDLTLILLLFADDMVIFGNSPEDLQNSLNGLHEYCSNWGLEVNTDKTKIMVFRKRGPLKMDEHWFYDNKEVEVVNDFIYLGTVFSYTGSFSLNQKTLAGKGLKAMNALLSNLKEFGFTSKTTCQLFDSFVGSILGYAGEVWGHSKSKELERVHLNFCKKLLGVKTTTSTLAIYGELGRYPLYINRHTRLIKYWAKVICSENVIVKTLYDVLLEDNENGSDNWCGNVKKLLEKSGFNYVWNNPYQVDLKSFHCIFKERLIDMFKQNWFEDTNQARILHIYRFLKTDFTMEPYLNILPKQLRIYVSRLRLSSHPLRIETGRYGVNRVDRNQRLCLLCNENEVEDEFHFILVCNKYKQTRNTYIKKFYYERPSMQKLVQLFQSNSPKIIYNLAKFIKYAFEIRNICINSMID